MKTGILPACVRIYSILFREREGAMRHVLDLNPRNLYLHEALTTSVACEPRPVSVVQGVSRNQYLVVP
jgi:hypothetical protein